MRERSCSDILVDKRCEHFLVGASQRFVRNRPPPLLLFSGKETEYYDVTKQIICRVFFSKRNSYFGKTEPK